MFEIITYYECLKIMLAKLTAQGRFEYQGKQVVPIDEHIRCGCDCVIKPSVIWE